MSLVGSSHDSPMARSRAPVIEAEQLGGHDRHARDVMPDDLPVPPGVMEPGIDLVPESRRGHNLRPGRAHPLTDRQRGVDHRRAGMETGTGLLEVGVPGHLRVHGSRHLGRHPAPISDQHRLRRPTEFGGIVAQAAAGHLVSHEAVAHRVDDQALDPVDSRAGDINERRWRVSRERAPP